MNNFIVRRTTAIGDSLAASVVATKLVAMGYPVTFESHPVNWPVLRRVRGISQIRAPGQAKPHVDLDGAYETAGDRRTKHVSRIYCEVANAALKPWNINLGPGRNCKPKLTRKYAPMPDHPRPWTMICPRSVSYVNRTIPDVAWAIAAHHINGTVFWLGTHEFHTPKIIDLKCRDLESLMEILAHADLLLTVDTGPMHIAAALGVPIIAIEQASRPDLHLGDQNDFISLDATGLDCLNCQEEACPIADPPPCQAVDVSLIADSVNQRLSAKGVSAVIPIYRPERVMLEACLNALLPQVNEIIVVSDGASVIPYGIMSHPRIGYLRASDEDIGFGRKVNFGVRHTVNPWILSINDDCILEHNAVAKMLEVATDKVGIVSCLLRYPTGTIQHSGKLRRPGERCWHHPDYQKMSPTFKQPVELENVVGACMLIRRKAFYDADGFDEDFWLYVEDDAFCLSMRQAGYKVMFTPYASGVHYEATSSKQRWPEAQASMARSHALFEAKWGKYLDWNRNRIPGNFDYLNRK